MCKCVSGLSRWGDKAGGWRDSEGEESVPMLSQEQTWIEDDIGDRDTETEDSEEEVLVRNIGGDTRGSSVIQS